LVSEPFAVVVHVKSSDGTNNTDKLKVSLRNNSTNEVVSLNALVNGEVVFNLGNLAEGWRDGDIISVFLVYSNFEAQNNFTANTNTGGTSFDLTLTTIPSSDELRYFGPQMFLDHFNMTLLEDDSERGVDIKRIIRIGVGVEGQIDEDTQGVWDNNGGDFYTATNETHDLRDRYHDTVFLEKKPISSLTTVQVNIGGDGVAENWQTLTETTDYELVDSETGMVKIHRNTYAASPGVSQVRITYKYGIATPNDIQRLAILMTGRAFVNSYIVKAIDKENTEFSVPNLAFLNDEIEGLVNNRRNIQGRNV